MYTYIIKTLSTLYHSDIFFPQEAILREYNWNSSAAKFK